MCTTLTATRHTEATRKAILDAATELFLDRRSDGFSVQEVADRAGLTHRTVYRYFPTRQELIGAAAQHLAPGFGEDSFGEVSSVEEWIDAVRAHLARTEANFEVVRRVLAAMLASEDLDLLARGLHERDAHRWGVFRRQFAHLSEDDAQRTFATLRHLTSSTTYVLYRLRFAMSPAEATQTIQSGAVQIVAEAARRDQAAEQEGRR
jgi:AcrR family transcriptional regulator